MKKVKMNAVIIKAWLEQFTEMEKDNYGNFKQIMPSGKEYRIKFQTTSVRFEVKMIFEASSYSPKRSEWMNVSSDYFKNIVITEDNKLKIGNKLIKAVK